MGRKKEKTTSKKEDDDDEVYAPQTKILEGRTNLSEGVFEALFNVL